MRVLCLVLCAVLALLCLPHTSHGVSYFGDSYCQIDAVQDLLNFHLSLQFKTSRRSGLLLLAAGNRDYLSLELVNGRLQARMDMGSGEVVLSSPTGVQLNNLIEHHVSLILHENKLSMTVDSLFSTFVDIQGEEEELNIDMGVFLGGIRDLDVEYLSTALPFLRGCMNNVKLESHQFNILSSTATICHDTKDGCSSEFEAGGGEAISFISPASFISFPTWTSANTGSRNMDFLMKTTIEDALLVFHPGHQSDFIALGMTGGYLKGIADLGSGRVSLHNVKVKLDDDQWHRIKMQVDPKTFEITVDSQSVSVPLDGSEKLDLVGNLYLGGIQGKIKDVFREDFLTHMEEEITSESFIGCLGEIKVNQKDRSLHDALITKDVNVKCEGEDYDYSSYYDLETTSTAPTQTTYLDILPKERHCLSTDMPAIFQNASKLLDITTLLVPEGGESFIDITNLNPMFNLNAAGIRQSQIIFTLQSDPAYGLIDMNISTRRTKKFTLLDVVNKKIKYLHDGNERYGDKIQLEVVAHGSSLPECLKTPHQYNLPVEILPVNDMPQITGGDIAVTANGRTSISPNIVKIADSDKRCDKLVVFVTSDPTPHGYLENSEHPGETLKTFTCRELKDGLIYYVHRGGPVDGFTLEVSDSNQLSQSATFKLTVTQPQLTLVTNTGLHLIQGDNSTIGIQNLAVSAPNNGDIIFNVTQPLIFGEIQVIAHGVSKRVSQFYQSDLEQNRLMYTSSILDNLDKTETEYIHFNAHLGQLTLPDNIFIITIMPAIKVNIVPLEIAPREARVITQSDLEVLVEGEDIDSAFVRYVIWKCPTLGVLMLQDIDLLDRDGFTQKDIEAGHISYRPTIHSDFDAMDNFQFKVFANDRYSQLYTYPISVKVDSSIPVLTNERLLVVKGNESTLSKEHLWVQTPQSTDFAYKIEQDPMHGHLIRDSPPGVPRFEGAVRVFSNEDILLNRLIYKHDGSEINHDQFTFLVYEVNSNSTNEQNKKQEVIKGTFHITVQSRNDYVPQRVINKPFSVVRNGQRLLTTDDILFKDDDSSFNDTQLVYVREGILSGSIVSSADASQPLYRFTQADLRDGKVLFVHHGADRDLFQLQVSDGLYKTTALLEVQAGDPYLHIVNNSMIVMDFSSTKTLDTSLLGTESNMDIRSASEIIYDINTPPGDGRIIVSGVEATQFTQEDLKKGVVSYEHSDQSLRSTDSFSFTVHANDLSENGTFRIKILKQGYLSEPQVTSNKVIITYEGEHSIIDQDHLKVEQADILPNEIVFSIKEPPRFGYVVKLINDTESSDSPILDYIQSFTQEDINMGIILYVSTLLQGQDMFITHVSNGFTTVKDLEVHVEIMPRFIPVQVANLTVREGDAVTLSEDILNITHPFYRSVHIEFLIENAPQHGDIRYLDKDEDGLVSFTWDDVQQGAVYYLHDSTETTEDSFTFSATAFELMRRSLSITMSITVIPVNDEAPQLGHNTGLELLVGEEAEITSKTLSTEDMDTSPDKVVYTIEAINNGIVALKESPDYGIEGFTQAQINNGEVMFIHKGSESGGFSFTVTDGDHTTPLHRFIVTVRQLTISLEVQGELLVFPGSRQVINSDIMRAVTSEDGDEISYSLMRPPHLGRLIKPNQSGHFEEISQFTQTELDAGAVFYEHQMPSESFWVVKDTVELELSSPPAAKLQHILPVTVAFYASHQNMSSQLWKNKGMSVVQGQSKVIDASILDASNLLGSVPLDKQVGQDITFVVQKFPIHGQLTLGGDDLPQDAPYFLQDDLSKGKLEYYHDDSIADSSDRFTFQVFLNPQSSPPQPLPDAVVLEELFLISIRQRDTSPPELVSLDLLLEALQGSTTVISKQYLNTIDQDSTPDEVRFTISKRPINGHIIYKETGDRIMHFTQEEVNMGQVAFVSDGSLSDGFMEFSVSDGKHQSEPYIMHIGILANKLVLNKVQEIQVKQGDDETPITEAMLKAFTEGPTEEEVLYKITNIPKYVVVMVDRQPTSAFTQKQIKERRVSVRFIKSTSSHDSFSFVARSRAANVSSSLNITVKPLANVAKDPLLPRGTIVLVDRQLLDATPLANKTKTSPTFILTQQPKGARFIRKGGSADGQPVQSFSQKDLDDGRVALEVLNSTGDPTAKGKEQHEAHFLLKAHGVPPAKCTLSFQTVPYDPAGNYGATILEVLPQANSDLSKEEQPDARKSKQDWPYVTGPTTPSTNSYKSPVSRRNSLWAILIPILVILLFLLLAGLLVYYLVHRNKTGKHNVQNAAANPKNGEVAQETFRKTDPSNNIPMSNMESKDADPELLQHSRTTNPALKKNQYWV